MTISFAEWMKQADHACYAKAGLSIYDLDDCPYRDWYDGRVTPRGAASPRSEILWSGVIGLTVC